MSLLTPIKLNISERLAKDKAFRKKFFRGQAQDEIAMSIVQLRKTRKKRQIDLAKEAGMKQSAISRIEQADYSRWSLNTLWRVADALDARLCITFEPLENVIEHYKEKEREAENWHFEQMIDFHKAIALKSDMLKEDLAEEVSDEKAPFFISSHI